MENKSRKIILSLVLFISLMTTCTITANAGTISNPTRINLGETITGNLTEKNTREYYELNLESSGRLYIDVSGLELGQYWYLEDTGGTLIYSYRDDNSDFAEIDLSKGTYIFYVESESSWGWEKPFTFYMSFKSANPAYENNNSFPDAVTIYKGQKVTGHLAVNNNTEYYKIKVSKKGKLTLYGQASADYGFFNIYNAHRKLVGELILRKSESGGKGLVTIPVKKGTYYIEAISEKKFYASEEFGKVEFNVNFPSSIIANGNLKYSVGSNNELTVTGLIKGNTETVVVPSIVKKYGKTYKVTKIGASAFKNNKSITSVTIGKNIKSIGANAFSNCGNISSINIKTSKLTSKKVGKNAFLNVGGLQSGSVSVKAPARKANKYKALLKGKGMSADIKMK